MVFTRKADDTLASLVKQIDQVVADNQDQNMASFVNFLGSDADGELDETRIATILADAKSTLE
jgi:hypothetical protein